MSESPRFDGVQIAPQSGAQAVERRERIGLYACDPVDQSLVTMFVHQVGELTDVLRGDAKLWGRRSALASEAHGEPASRRSASRG